MLNNLVAPLFNAASGALNSLRATTYAYNQRALTPIEAWGWDTFEARQFRYYNNRAYYHNTIYTELTNYLIQMKKAKRLSKTIRGIYNPVRRLVDIYPAKCYGGNLDMRELTGGAIPIITDNRRLRDAIKQLWIWSNWNTQKATYVRNGAMLGDSPLKIVDEPDKGRVRLETLDPAKIKSMELDSVGNVQSVVIEYERYDQQPTSVYADTFRNYSYVYSEVITKDRFETYKNGNPFAYYTDPAGTPVPAWDNPYGFVPLVNCQHISTGLKFGTTPFLDSIEKIDLLNDTATMAYVQLKKVVNAIWYTTGADAQDLTIQTKHNTTDDEVPMLYGPEGSRITPLITPIPLGSALAQIEAMANELERDMPELSLHEVRSGGRLTAPGISTAYQDASDRISEACTRYDDALTRAQQMAITIGGIRGYQGFEGFDLNSYDAGDLIHFIGERELVKDRLSLQEKVTVLVQTGAPKRAIWLQMGYSTDQVRQWEAMLAIDPATVEQRMNARIAALSAGVDPIDVLGDESALPAPAGGAGGATQPALPAVNPNTTF